MARLLLHPTLPGKLLRSAGFKLYKRITDECPCPCDGGGPCITCTVLGEEVCLPETLYLTLDWQGMAGCAECYESWNPIPLTYDGVSEWTTPAGYFDPDPTSSGQPCAGIDRIYYTCGSDIVILANAGSDSLLVANQTLVSASPFLLTGTQNAIAACTFLVFFPGPLFYSLSE